MMGLRLVDGVSRARFAAEIGQEIEAALDPARLEELAAAGFLIVDTGGIRATPAGLQRLNAVLAALLA